VRSNTSILEKRLLCGVSASIMILGAGLLAPTMAAAQDTSGEADIEAVVVTGTRLAGFDAPTPVTTLGGAELQANNARNVADLVTDIPELRVRRNIGQTLIPVGLAQIDLRGLNGLNSSQRTLVMIDGRRVAPTAPNGWIDANVIPTSLLNRVEVVTGGASAAYGSDAVAGVVNFILDRQYEGFKFDLSYGQSKYSDNRQPAASVAAGHSFGNGKGHAIFSADYFRDSGQLSQENRPWGREHWCTNSTTRNGRPFTFYRANCTMSQASAGGVTAISAPAPLQNIQFGPGGVVQPFNRGADVGASFMTGGDGYYMQNQTIAIKTKRFSAFAGLDYKVSDAFELFADGIYSRVRVYADTALLNDQATQTQAALITRDNPFLPASIRTIMANNNIASFRLGRVYLENGAVGSNIGTDYSRVTFGAKGKLGSRWDWESFVAVSRTHYTNESMNQRDQQKFALGVDVVTNPANGQPICRSTLTNPTNGCVPLNVIGVNSLSQSMVNYYTGTASQDAHQKEDIWATTLRGTPIDLPAGPVSVAAGFEFRRDEINSVGDEVSNQSLQGSTFGWRNTNFPSYGGEVTVKEAFGEVGVPLLANMTLVKKLDVNAAGRITDYSVSGTVKTWKLGANYEPDEQIRFRGTISRDIRAPTIFELYRPLSASLINVVADPRTGVSTSVFQRTGGNPNLRPEIAKTYTGGVVLSPNFLRGFRMSVDYYKINIKDVITNLTIQQTFDQCFKANVAEQCALITINPATNTITEVSGKDVNSAVLKTAGVDIEAQYRIPLADLGMGSGSVTLRSLGSYTEYRRTTTNGVVVNLAGQNYNGIPFWRVNSSITYENGPIMIRATHRFMSGGAIDLTKVEGRDVETNRLRASNYIDLAASYQLNKNWQVYGNVNNLFNQDPPLGVSPITEPGYQGGGNYDLIGMWWSVGVRAKF
jgi:outer membrane receptor protein involved in Fe transport